jgi:hypothetical protein
MAGIFDYLAWRGDLSFKSAPFNPVDNVIFSILAYYPFEKFVGGPDEETSVRLHDAIDLILVQIKKNPKKLNMYYFFKDDQYKLLYTLKKCERYSGVSIAAFVDHIDTHAEVQFSALTFLPEEGRPAYIAYRGTDSSLVGWKEDFNMIFADTIPAQLEAAAYLDTVSKRFKGDCYVGGHSKGGNLAVYAGAFCRPAVKKRIITIYSNDGPGLTPKTAARTEYAEVKDRIVSYIPQDSIIGLLFEQRKHSVVKSGESGFLQHNPLLWEVTRNGFCMQDDVTRQSRFVNTTLMRWLESMDYEHRQRFIGALFELLMSTNAASVPDLTADWLKSARLMASSLTQFDKETRTMLGKTFASLFDIAKNNLVEKIEKKISTRKTAAVTSAAAKTAAAKTKK